MAWVKLQHSTTHD